MTVLLESYYYLLISVANPDPGFGAFLTPGSGMGKETQDPDPETVSGMNNPDHISESLEPIFWVKILDFFDVDPGSGMEKFGSGINIPDPQHCYL
jgi:hypothetical protein